MFSRRRALQKHFCRHNFFNFAFVESVLKIYLLRHEPYLSNTKVVCGLYLSYITFFFFVIIIIFLFGWDLFALLAVWTLWIVLTCWERLHVFALIWLYCFLSAWFYIYSDFYELSLVKLAFIIGTSFWHKRFKRFLWAFTCQVRLSFKHKNNSPIFQKAFICQVSFHSWAGFWHKNKLKNFEK